MIWTTQPRFSLGGELQGYRIGEGPPMLLLHGVGMRSEFWASLITELRADFCITVVDLPGHGHSESLAASDLNLARYSDRIVDAIDKATIVIGHSLGALIALDLAARYTQRVSGLGVINGIYRRDESASIQVCKRAAQLATQSATQVATQVEKAGDTRAPLDNKATLSRWFGTDPQGIEKDAAAACDHWLREADPTGYSDAYQVFAHSDAPDDAVLRTLSVPALVATGNEDPNSSPSMTRAVAALLPDAQHLIVDKARHMMPMTHSTELAHALLRRFSTSPSV